MTSALIFALPEIFLSPHSGHEVTFFEFLSHIAIYWVNFLLYVGLLYFFLGNRARQFWASRREQIAAQVVSSGNALQQAKRKMQENEARLAKLKEQQDLVRREIEADTARIKEEILAMAKERSKRIVVQGEQDAIKEELALTQKYRNGLVSQLLQGARAEIRERLTKEGDRNFRTKLVDSIARVVN